jgi:murein DD-endopeptidase MepM/ murein hydrolase activator NlpD
MSSGEPVGLPARVSLPRQRYSRHYLEQQTSLPRLAQGADGAAAADDEPLGIEADVAEPAENPRPWRRSPWAGLVGLASLVGLIWISAELWQSTFKADAQEADAPVTEVAAAPSTPWQSASFPVENFVAYTSPFGYRNHPYGGRRFHYGLDIAAPMGSYIRSWWEGTVARVSDNTACGTGIVIESQGWVHIYCHMQGHLVVETDGDRWLVDHEGGIQIRQGDLVKSGQRIGRVGMTGSTTGPHLHWGMKYQGSWVDPTVVLKAMMEK